MKETARPAEGRRDVEGIAGRVGYKAGWVVAGAISNKSPGLKNWRAPNMIFEVDFCGFLGETG
jgi:hypothetical protein